MPTCPTCGRDAFETEGGMRRHHTAVHDERLPNATCEFCGRTWNDETSDRKRCPDCPDTVSPPPDDYQGTVEEWVSLSAYQRWYRENKRAEKERTQTRRDALREWFEGLKDEYECACCGESRNPALDFHHEGEERLGVSEMVDNGWARENILAEIEKCEVLCANCHRVRHA